MNAAEPASTRHSGSEATRHHELARMEKGNFNVSFPLWDWLVGTLLPAAETCVGKAAHGRVRPKGVAT